MAKERVNNRAMNVVVKSSSTSQYGLLSYGDSKEKHVKIRKFKGPKKEEEVYVDLVEEYEGVALWLVDRQGNRMPQGRIATLDPDGILRICPSLTPHTNLQIGVNHTGIRVKYT